MKTEKYEEVFKKHQVKPRYVRNMLQAFFFGGCVCLVGQILIEFYIKQFGLVRETASLLMTVTVIFIASLLTGLGVYDNYGQIAKAGGFVPITGFANSLTSAAVEGKSEGILFGIATNVFKLAGAVIVFAVVAAYVFGIIRYGLIEFNVLPEPKTIQGLYFINFM